MRANSCGLGTGRLRKRTASMRPKIAVFAPMPSARERTATAMNPGLRRKTRGGVADVLSEAVQPQASRTFSLISARLPRARRSCSSASSSR
jgi:hypothetical protein